MSATNAQNARNAVDQTVAVIPTGLVGNPYYYQDGERFVSKLMDEIDSLAAMTGSVSEVIVRGSYEVAELIEEHTDDGIEADSYSMDFRMFLDDEGEESDDYTVQGVIGDGRPMAEIVGEVHDLPESEVQSFDLSDREDRSMIDFDVLSALEETDEGQARIGRAKAKSKGKATEMLMNDFHDFVSTADHTIILEDGTDDYQNAAEDVRGNHNWAKYPTACAGEIRSLMFSGGDGGVLNWTHALLNRDQIETDELSEGQIERLQETLDDGQLEQFDIEPAAEDSEAEDEADEEPSELPTGDSRPPAEAAAVAGQPADD